MAPDGYYAATESLVLDSEVDHFDTLGHVLWSITVNLYQRSGEWTMNCLSERDGQWKQTYRLVNIKESTTIDDLLRAQQLADAPSQMCDADNGFCIVVRNSDIPVPRLGRGVGQTATSYDYDY